MKNVTLPAVILLFLFAPSLSAQPVADHASGLFTTGIYEFAIGGEDFYARADREVIRSTDDGLLWEPLLIPMQEGEGLLEIEASGELLWGVTDAGLYRWKSTEKIWTRVSDRIHTGLHATPEGSLIGTGRKSGDLERSTDEGETWQIVVGEFRLHHAVTGSDQRIWVTDSSRVLVSENDGESFSRFGGESPTVSAVYLYPLDNGEVLALGRKRSWISDRTTGEWHPHGDLPAHKRIVALFQNPNLPGAFFLGLTDSTVEEPTRYHLSGDSGKIWTNSGWTSFGITQRYLSSPQHALLVDRTDSILLIAASFRSSFVSAEPYSDIGQIIRSVPGDINYTWTLNFTGSLGTSRITSLVVGPDGMLYTGRLMPYFMEYEHDRWAFRSSDGGESWEDMQVGEEGGNFSITSDNTLYVTGSRDALFRSTDRGGSWDTIRIAEDVEWRPVGRIIEVEPDLLLVETVDEQVNLVTWMSTDRGITWSFVGSRKHFGGVRENVVDSENRILTIGGKLAYVSLDSGRTWIWRTVSTDVSHVTTDITLLRNGNPLVSMTSGRLYTSTDHGKSWDVVTSDLDDQLEVMVTDQDGNLYGGGRSGTVWRSSDEGRTWRAWVRIPKPSSVVTTLAIGQDGYLYIGTELRGVWRASIGEIGDVSPGGRTIERIDLR